MKTNLTLLIPILLLFLNTQNLFCSNPTPKDNDQTFLIHYWFFGNSLPAETPLQTIQPVYAYNGGGLLQFQSALSGYPFTPFHPNWRKASLERRNAPTPLNYLPEGNDYIPYESSGTTGIQIKQPFTGDGGENTLIFHLPSSGFRELVFRFAAKDEGAADALRFDYSAAAGNPQWTTQGLTTTIFSLGDNYLLYELNFTEEATQSPPPPPNHGLEDDQLSVATVMLVNNNPDFKIRIRFIGDNMSINEGKRVTFNNFSFEGEIATEPHQVIQLSQGWSGISSYLIPDAPSIETIFSRIGSAFIFMENFDGFYWPASGTNTLGNWDVLDGYAVKVNYQTRIAIVGQENVNPNFVVESGWSYLPVLSPCSQTVSSLFSTVGNNLVVVKEIAGNKVFWPAMGINTLGNVHPGKAYLVLMQNTGEITFADCDVTLSGEIPEDFDNPDNALETGITRTPLTHSVAFFSSISELFTEGDIITAVDAGGNKVGALTWQNENAVLAIYGNDPTTPEKDGLEELEPFELRLIKNGNGTEYKLEVNYDPSLPQASSLFVTNGLSAIIEMSLRVRVIPINNLSVQIYPNPAQDEIIISVDDLTFTEGNLVIRRIDGSVVQQSVANQNPSEINIKSLQPGVYILQLSVDGNSVNKRFVKM